MANRSNISIPNWVHRVNQNRALMVPIGLVSLLGVIIVPLPPIVIDLLLTANLALAALILLTTIFVESPLDFSVFPSLLLFTTMFRLVLNIATTRMILTADAATPGEATAVAGKLIQSFAEFVAGSQPIVGVILFVILIIIQFVVITKGATRISEVAARFMLDGMPGKQMAVDADLNAGLINEQQARERRETIQHEADFHGAMDGASKFVRGDAVAGIIITLVNIVGGLAIGMFMKNWSFGEAMMTFTKLTIGDGLVSQVPAFLIAMAAGLIVTRSSSRSDLNTELTQQLTGKSAAMGITASFLAALAFTPLPTVPMFAMALVAAGLAYNASRQKKQVAQQVERKQKQAEQTQEPEPIEQAMQVDALELEVGYGLVKLVDTTQGGDLLEWITKTRRQLAVELGVVMPPVRIHDNMQLQPNDYYLKIRGNTVAQGQVYPGQYLAMDGGLASPGSADQLQGRHTVEPAFGYKAVWIDPGQKQRAETLNYMVVAPSLVLTTHLSEVVKSHADEMLSREETNNLITQMREKAPKLCDEVLGKPAATDPPLVRAGELQKVLQSLLRERVPIRDMETVVETLGDWATRTKDLDVLTEYVRNALRRTICGQYVVEEPADPLAGSEGGAMTSKLYCVSLDPALEDQINGYIERSAEGTSMAMPPQVANKITSGIIGEANRLIQNGRHPVILASPQVRAQVRKLIEPHLPSAAVLGYNEISKGVVVESLGMVPLDPPAAAPQQMPAADNMPGAAPAPATDSTPSQPVGAI
ncbi:MAG: flagellar biosynthesis protein FlhA [Planctomycetota bacterium]